MLLLLLITIVDNEWIEFHTVIIRRGSLMEMKVYVHVNDLQG